VLVEAGPADPDAFSEANLRQLCAIWMAVERTPGYAEAGPFTVQCTGALWMTSRQESFPQMALQCVPVHFFL